MAQLARYARNRPEYEVGFASIISAI